MLRIICKMRHLLLLIPLIVAYEKCNVEDAGSVETSATTGKYVGLRQGQGFPFELLVYSYDLFIFTQTFLFGTPAKAALKKARWSTGMSIAGFVTVENQSDLKGQLL